MLDDNKVARLRASGVVLLDPKSTRIDESSIIEPGTIIHANVAVLGRSLIAANCIIHQGTELFDVFLGDSSIVRMCCDIRESTIGKEARLGPFIELHRVEAGDAFTISSQTHIVRCSFASNAKVSSGVHLADTIVGARAHFSSGARTANYDGAMKHRIVIGDDVHIGANALLIAPIHIGDGATVGGGSVLSKDVSAGVLAVARAKQVEIAGWQRPRRKADPTDDTDGALQVVAGMPRERQLENRLAHFRQLVDGCATEQVYHAFLAENYWLCGTGYIDCTSKVRAGADRIPDLLLERHDGLFDVVEIKRPSAKLFSKTGTRAVESQELKSAVAQAHDYLDYFETYRLAESYSRTSDFRVAKAKVILGRCATPEDKKALARINSRYSRIEVLSFDDLLIIGESMRAHMVRVQKVLNDSSAA